MTRPHVLVIGAGPIGLEASVLLVKSGFGVTLVERGDRVAASVRHWGHVRLFSTNELNTTAWGRAACEEAGVTPPDAQAYPTGDALATSYLDVLHRWLTESPDATVLLGTSVVALSRGALLKNEQVAAIGETARAATPFRALLASADDERFLEGLAAVLDCSGTYGNGAALGQGGAPALGERQLRARGAPALFADGLPDVRGRDAATFAPPPGGERRVCLVGGGYSAATTLLGLLEAARRAPEGGRMHIDWCLRRPSGGAPYERVEDDPLPARAALVDAANQLALAAEGGAEVAAKQLGGELLPPNVTLRVLRGATVEAARSRGEGGGGGGGGVVVCGEAEAAEATEAAGEGGEDVGGEAAALGTRKKRGRFELSADVLVAHVGFRPDTSVARELHVHHCYASEGPMKLASSLLAARVAAKGGGAGGGGGDCLKQATPGPEQLVTPEPRFFVLGAKSYGRNSAFLLKLGHAQAEAVVQLLQKDLGVPLEGAARE